MKHFIIGCILILVLSPIKEGFGQGVLSQPQLNADGSSRYVLKNELSLGVRLNTTGYTIFGERVKFISVDKKRIYQLEFQSFKHPKEAKQPGDPSGNTSKRDYVYGKRNNFFAFHLNYGFRKKIGDKTGKAGVKVSMVYMAGASLGILKPYYLNLLVPDAEVPSSLPEAYSAENADRFLDKTQIDGASGLRYGFDGLKPLPGVHGKFGINFDWASKEDFVKSLETGVALDIYPKEVPIMIADVNQPYFISLYLGLQFGKRW